MHYPIIDNQVTSEGHLLLDLKIPQNLDYFDGHFDEFPILAGVVQMHWVIHYLSKAIGKKCTYTSIKNIKYMNMISPLECLQLEMSWKEHAASFIYHSADKKFSKGSFVFRYIEESDCV